MTRQPFGSLITLLCTGALACASPPLAECPPDFLEKPPISAECRADPASQQYVADAIDRLSSRLEHRWSKTNPGQLHVSVAYDSAAGVQSVCSRALRGESVRERSAAAVRALRNAPAAPQCFADHRIEIEWESALVTDAELQIVLDRCDAPAVVRHAACHSGCSIEETALLSRADEHVFGCLISELPLAFGWAGGSELVTFLPVADPPPTAERAFAASEACGRGLADRDALVSCMSEHGWEEVDWPVRRQSLIP